jgi:hypothetical protein
MKMPLTSTFRLSKWSLFALFGLITLCADISSFPSEQRIPVQTEQRDVERSVKPHIPFSKFCQPAKGVSFSFKPEFLPSLSFYLRSVEVRYKNRIDCISEFTSLGIKLAANSLPRSVVSSLSNQG